MRSRLSSTLLTMPLAFALGCAVTAPVAAQKSSRVILLPAELLPFQAAALSARVSGFFPTKL